MADEVATPPVSPEPTAAPTTTNIPVTEVDGSAPAEPVTVVPAPVQPPVAPPVAAPTKPTSTAVKPTTPVIALDPVQIDTLRKLFNEVEVLIVRTDTLLTGSADAKKLHNILNGAKDWIASKIGLVKDDLGNYK